MKTKLIRAGMVILVILASVFMFAMPVFASPTCTLSLSTVNQTVNAGDSFDIMLNINISGGTTRTANCSLNYDPVKLQCTGVDLGAFYKDWAQQNSANGASVMILPTSPVPVDNVNGNIQPGLAIFGDYLGGGPTGTGVVFIYHMKANSGATGTTSVHTSDVEMADGSNPPATIPGVTVQNDNMQITINNQNAAPAPTVTSFTPASAAAGASVVITGANFTGAGAVKFGNTAAQSFTVNSNTQITAVVASGATGVISVTTPSGTGSSSSSFTFIHPPVITGLTPTSGGTGTSIIITGTSFTGATAVKFGTVAAQSFTVNSATQITAVVGNGESGYVNVTTPAGNSPQTNAFTFTQNAAITSFNPLSGGTGTSIIITGANFTGATAVSFGGTAAQSYQVNSSTQITAVVGTGASGGVSVTTVGTPATKTGFTFTTATTSTSTTSTTSTTPTTSATSTTTTTSTTTPTTASTTVPPTLSTTTTQSTAISRTQTTTKLTQVPRVSSLLGTGLITSLDLSDSMDTGGMLQTDFLQGNIRYSGNNQIVSLDIINGTRIIATDGSPVSNISIQDGANMPSAPTGQKIVSAVDFEPSGTTFSSPIIVVFGYDPTMVPRNISAKGLALQYFDNATNKWVKADCTVDTQNHQITANLSHFSLYAVMASTNAGFTGVGWNLAGIIIILEMLLGGLAIYYFLRRKQPLTPATVQATQLVMEVGTAGVPAASKIIDAKESPLIWDDILPRNVKKGEPFKTHLEIIGGKIIIPTGTDSVGIELVNNPDSRILVSLEYDPELHPRGLAKIMVLGAIGSAEYQKSKGDQ